MGLFAGVTFLTKGIHAVAFLVVVLPLLSVRQHVFRSRQMGYGAAITLLLALPWPLTVYARYGETFLEQFRAGINLAPASALPPGTRVDQLLPFTDFPHLQQLLFDPAVFHPWTFVLGSTLVATLYRRIFADTEIGLGRGLVVWWLAATLGLALLAGAGVWQLMPFFVPAAVLVGTEMKGAVDGAGPAMAAVALGVVALLSLSPTYTFTPGSGASIGRATVVVAGVVGLVWLPPIRERLSGVPSWLLRGAETVAPLVVVAILLGTVVGAPSPDGQSSAQRTLADEVASNTEDSAVIFVETGMTVPLHTFSFYAERPLAGGPVSALGDHDARYAVLRPASLARVGADTRSLTTVETGGQTLVLVEVLR
jgi:hypothetical protein